MLLLLLLRTIARMYRADARASSYFEKVNVHCDVLDPDLHTPASTFARCPFLFTVGAFPSSTSLGSLVRWLTA